MLTFLMALSSFVNTGNVPQIIALNGGIASTAVVASLILTEVVKPAWDALIKPSGANAALHDMFVRLTALAIALGAVVAMLWAFNAIGDRATTATALIDTFTGWAIAEGIYRQQHPVPATPTAGYLNRAGAILGGLTQLLETQGSTGASAEPPASVPVPEPPASTTDAQPPVLGL